jgi:hypothetical protein
MKDSILQAYQDERDSSHPDSKAPALTAHDHAVAAIAALYSENDLRQAAAMRGAYERKQRREGLAAQRKAKAVK